MMRQLKSIIFFNFFLKQMYIFQLICILQALFRFIKKCFCVSIAILIYLIALAEKRWSVLTRTYIMLYWYENEYTVDKRRSDFILDYLVSLAWKY